MKQLLQTYGTGKVELAEVPAPAVQPGYVLVRVRASAVSVGTEKHMFDFAKKTLAAKALARPDLVRKVIAKLKTEGLMEAWRQSKARLDAPAPVGYSVAGVVEGVGAGVRGISVGDRVACVGAGQASHAELVSIPHSQCVRVPGSVDDETAAFVALGGIALQAVQKAKVSAGDTVAVIGLGLLGQLSVQLLKAKGCRVLGMDLDPAKAARALESGADMAASDYNRFSASSADAVVIFAATLSNEPLERAAELCRERGRVVAAGLIGLEVPRRPFFEKELELVVPKAWGPRENLEEVIAHCADGRMRVTPLITHRFPFEKAAEAYETLLGGKVPCVGVVLTFGASLTRPSATLSRERERDGVRASSIGVGVIGAGLFARGTMLPALKGIRGLRRTGVVSARGLGAKHLADKGGFAFCGSEPRRLFEDPATDAVLVLTRHGSHAALAAQALVSGKHVFVEKPLALDYDQLHLVRAALDAASDRAFLVGFNRRFSPFTLWLKQRFAGTAGPKSIHITVNAGALEKDSWVLDAEDGGGRLLSEGCHFIDLAQFLADSRAVRVHAQRSGSSQDLLITLTMADGSLASITYASGGDAAWPRERVEMLGGGAAGAIENFKSASFSCDGRSQSIRNWFSVDRGHSAQMRVFFDAVRGGAAAASREDLLWSSLATLRAQESLDKATPVDVRWPEDLA